jgi:threonine dehydrogenase-like Zn-dependent dehydrogenase
MCYEAALIGFARFGKESVLYNTYHDGSLAEYIRVPYWLLDPLPDNVSFDVAAKIHDAATALSALKLAELPRDSTIVITAATGTMGTLTLRLAQQFPIKRVILLGRSKERLESVRGLTSLETAILSLGDQCSKKADGHTIGAIVPQLKGMAPDGINAIIDWLPSGDVIGQILPALSTGGTVVHMGGNISPLPIPLVVIMANCWKLVGSRANTREDTSQILAWLAEGRIDIADLITHRFNLKEIDKALEVMENRSEPVWLSVIQVST